MSLCSTSGYRSTLHRLHPFGHEWLCLTTSSCLWVSLLYHYAQYHNSSCPHYNRCCHSLNCLLLNSSRSERYVLVKVQSSLRFLTACIITKIIVHVNGLLIKSHIFFLFSFKIFKIIAFLYGLIFSL